jgi:hypothetical protein
MSGFKCSTCFTCSRRFLRKIPRAALCSPIIIALSAFPAAAQVFTVTPEGIDGKYLDFQPTNIALPTAPLTNHNREDLLRFLQSEQGFTMRPLPISTLTLHANGKMEPSGSDYVNAIRDKGLAVKAGERVVLTDIKIEKDRLLLDFNGGPEHKHKWLRHISVGMDPNMTTPIVRDDQQAPSGTRITLIFPNEVPDVTGLQVEALIKPIVDFNLKTPVQAYSDTLPPAIRKSILDHHVLVGMNGDMVIAALGRPKDKIRETESQVPFEEWIYGEPPDPVQFIRFNNNRVIRVEIAKVGEPPVIRTENEMGDYWSKQPAENTRIVKLGDQAPAKPDGETAPHAPPSLRLPGEKLPGDDDPNRPQMAPVQYPQGQQPSGQTKPQSTPQTQTAGQGNAPSGQSGSQSQSGAGQSQSTSSQTQSSPASQPSPPPASQSPPPGSNPLLASGRPAS